MNADNNIKSILKNNLIAPSYLLDSELRIVELNEKGEQFFSKVNVGDNLFEKFKKSTRGFLERIILEVANFEKPQTERITVEKQESNEIAKEYTVSISPLTIDRYEYYLVSFLLNQGAVKSVRENYSKNRFSIITTDIGQIIEENNLSEILDNIKSSYPFSLIEKSKFQNKIDVIPFSFWMKDAQGKFIIANSEFASTLGLKSAQIEGRNETDLLPPHLQTLYHSLNTYIKDTSNTIILDGIKYSGEDSNEKTEIIEFPLTDIDNDVVAIIGFTRKVVLQKKSTKKVSTIADSAFTTDSDAKAVISNTGEIKIASVGLNKILGLNITLNLIGKDIGKIIGEDFVPQLKYQRNNQSTKNFEFLYRAILEDARQKDFKIIAQLIKDDKDEEVGCLIKFNAIDETVTETSNKGKMFDLLMKNSPEAIFIYEVENLKFLEVNETALKLYGYTRDQFLSMDLTDLYAPEDIQTLLESTSGKVADNKFTGPWKHKRRDGASIFVELSKTSSEFNGKNAHLNIVRDVTEQIENKKQMEVFRTIFENSSDVILITDADGFITFSNEAAEGKLGYLPSELEKRPFLSLLSDGDRAKVNMNIFQSSEKEPISLDVKVKNISGDLITAGVSATPILDYSKEIESYVLVVKTKTDEEVPQYTNAAPVQKNTGGNLDPSFLSNLFHELLTPMNVIVGFVQELTDSIENPTEEQNESTEIIKENQKILLQTMDTAVEYSQIENNSVKLKQEEVVFVELLDSLESSAKRISESEKVELSYSKISSSLQFTTDKQKFISLMNLLIKFSLKMTDKKHVYLSAYSVNDESFIVSVKDERKGISDGLLKNLRELFTVDESILRHNFGLSRFTIRLARKLVELLSLRKEIVQKDGKPSEFAIVFPSELKVETIATLEEETSVEEKVEEIKMPSAIEDIGFKSPEPEVIVEPKVESEPVKVETKHEVTVNETSKKEEPVPVAKKGIDYSQLSCLYVEDQIDSQILFKVQMKTLKLIDFSASFEDAVPLLKTKSYNFIVMDINLQGEYNGLDALRLIRKMPAYQDIPIIAASAYVLPGDKEKFIAAGFNDFISKPVLQDKLHESLEKVFS